MACYNMSEDVVQLHNNPVLAMEHYEKIRYAAEENNDKGLYCQAVGNMAKIYSNLNCYNEAMEMYRECLEKMKNLTSLCAEQEDFLCEMAAEYGYCLLMADEPEEASKAAKEVEALVSSKKRAVSARLAAMIFLIKWAEKIGRKQEAEAYLEQAIQIVLDRDTVIVEWEQVLKLIRCLVEREQFERLRTVLVWAETEAAVARKETVLLQLLLYQLQYCSGDMAPDEFQRNVQDFFRLKSRYEHAENSQILQMTKLRDTLKENEAEQTRLLEENSRLVYRTQHDELSGLYNKRYLSHYMEELFEEAMEKELPLGVLFLDIDYFKQMNDHYGHQKGDDCIIAISDAIRTCMQDDFAARYGGDEFVILTIGRSREYMEERAKMLVDNIRQREIPNEDSPYVKIVTITIGGVHAVPHFPNKIWDFLTAADEALYRQKEEQKGRVRFYEVQEDGL